MNDPTTLRKRLVQAGAEAAVERDEWRESDWEAVARGACIELLAEIERRCTERGYAYLMGYPWYADDEQVVGEPLADFIAELRGEVSGGD